MGDQQFMEMALALAGKDPKEVPVAALIVLDGQVISLAHNEQVARGDATAHAELLAIQRAQAHTGRPRLFGCTLYVTLEPCPMCAGAIVLSGIDRVVFAAFDPQQGCCGSVYALPLEPSFHHQARCEGGLMQEAAQKQLQDFFAGIRQKQPGTSV